MSAKNMVFDTGSSQIYLPTVEYEQFIDEVNKVKKCEYRDYDSLVYCECVDERDAGWPKIKFEIEDSRSKV